ncbi:MAG: DegT/DnrJ/EryC1/StrS family aminotransferase, partial [Cyclobacteriaceae bacterium]
SNGIPSMIYYPVPLHLQKAYQAAGFGRSSFPASEKLSETVISLPIHTEMSEDQLSFIVDVVKEFRTT